MLLPFAVSKSPKKAAASSGIPPTQIGGEDTSNAHTPQEELGTCVGHWIERGDAMLTQYSVLTSLMGGGMPYKVTGGIAFGVTSSSTS